MSLTKYQNMILVLSAGLGFHYNCRGNRQDSVEGVIDHHRLNHGVMWSEVAQFYVSKL